MPYSRYDKYQSREMIDRQLKIRGAISIYWLATITAVAASVILLNQYLLPASPVQARLEPTTAGKKTPAATPVAGQIIADPKNPAWLIYNRDRDHDGRADPLFLAGPGDPEDFLYRGKRNADGTRDGDQLRIIDRLRASGANSIYMQAIRSHGGDGEADHNPFMTASPDAGIDADILAQWDSWLTAMDNNGIVAYFFFYDDAIDVSKNLGWPLDATGNLHPAEKNYIETIVDKLKHHKHLIWNVMEEVQEMGSDYVSHAKKIAQTIREADEYHHAIAIHKLSGDEFDEFAEDDNIDQFAMQTDARGAVKIHDAVASAWQKAAGRYNINLAEAADHVAKTGAELRQINWAIAMAGAYVMVLGMDVANTPLTDLADLGALRRFMESTDFNTMTPDDSLAYAGTRYVLANPGHSYIAYSNRPATNIGIRQLAAGHYDLRWFDPASGQYFRQDKVELAAGDHSWPRPIGFGAETALYLTRQ
jgi:hypothetical protein